MSHNKICFVFQFKEDDRIGFQTIVHINEVFQSVDVPHTLLAIIDPRLNKSIIRASALQKKIKEFDYISPTHHGLGFDRKLFEKYQMCHLFAFVPHQGLIHTSELKNYYFHTDGYDYLWSSPKTPTPTNTDNGEKKSLWKKIQDYLTLSSYSELETGVTSNHKANPDQIAKFYKKELIAKYFELHTQDESLFPLDEHFPPFHQRIESYRTIPLHRSRHF